MTNKIKNKNLFESSVILSSNSSHYLHTALGYYKHNILKKFYTSFMLEEKRYYHFIKMVNEILSNRYLGELPKEFVQNIMLPEVCAKFLMKYSSNTMSEIYKIQNSIYGKKFYKYIKNENYRVMHFTSGLGLEAIEDAKNKNAVIVCDTRSIYYKAEEKLMNKEKISSGFSWTLPENSFFDRLDYEYDNSDYIIVNSNFAKKTFIDFGFPKEKLKTIHLGVDKKYFYPSQSKIESTKDIFRVIFIGTVDARKGFHYLIEAWEWFNNKDAELIVLGSVNKEFKNLKTKQNNVKFYNHMPHQKITSILNSCSVMVLPSVYDSFGLVGLEALSSGVPLITNSNCGVSELITDGLDGFVVEPGNSKALLNKMRLLYENKEMISEMKRNTVLSATKHGWSNYQYSLIDFIYDII